MKVLDYCGLLALALGVLIFAERCQPDTAGIERAMAQRQELMQ